MPIDFYGRPSGFLEAYHGDFENLQKILKKDEAKQHINHSSEKNGGHTLAHFACYKNRNVRILELLQQEGADLFKEDIFGRSPVWVAANAGSYVMIQYLLELHKKSEETMKITTKLDKTGRSIIHAICSLCSSPTDKADDKEMARSLQLLLQCYPNNTARKQALEQSDNWGYAPVHLAIFSGYIKPDIRTEFSEVFEQYGINPGQISTPKKGILPEHHDFFFRTKLRLAAFAGSLESVRVELSKPNADPNEGNEQHGGRSALHLACAGISGPDILKAIMEHPATDMMQHDHGHAHALMYAAHSGRIDIMTILLQGITLPDGEIKRFPKEKINEQDHNGLTALHAVAMASSRPDSRKEVVKLLISTGADTTLRDKNGNTALDLARMYDNLNVVEAIHGAPTEAASGKQEVAELTSSFTTIFKQFPTKTLKSEEKAPNERGENSIYQQGPNLSVQRP